MIKHTCTKCSKEYYKRPSIKNTRFCSRECMYAFGHTDETKAIIKAKRALQVIKTKPVKRSGYIYHKSWGHPACGKQGYVAEHRLVMEKHIGRYLTKIEVVHHINHDITDNRIENLQLFSSPGEHTRIAHPEIFAEQSIKFKGKHFSPATEFKKKS